MRGGNGDDIIRGGIGNDTLIGERGADFFEFTDGDGQDRMLGFGTGDAIQIATNDVGQVQIDQNGRLWRIEYGITDSIDIRADPGIDLVVGENLLLVPLIDDLN